MIEAIVRDLLVGACVDLQERSTGYFGELESQAMDLTDRVITQAGYSSEDWINEA